MKLINKKNIIIGAIGCTIGGVGYLSYFNHPLELQKNVFTYELGEVVELKTENYLSNKSHKDVFDNAKLIGDLTYVEGKKYPALGSYSFKMSYKKKEKPFKIEIKDTTKPEWIQKVDELTFTESKDKMDLNKIINEKFKAKDLSNVKLSIKESNLNIPKKGEYKAIIQAEDEGGNIITHDVKIHVKAKAKEVKKPSKGKSYALPPKNTYNPQAVIKPQTAIPSHPIKMKTREECLKGLPNSFPKGNLSDNVHFVVNSIAETVLQKPTGTKVVLEFENISKEEIEEAIKFVYKEINNDDFSYLIWDSKTKENVKEAHFFTIAFSSYVKYRQNDILAYNALKKAGVKSGMSDREAVIRINKWICKHMTYVVNNGEDDIGFKTGRGQCMTYAQMFQHMCDVANIPCYYVTGPANGINGWECHAWNKVKVGGSWYYVDATWNDARPNQYLLSKTVWKDHKLEDIYRPPFNLGARL